MNRGQLLLLEQNERRKEAAAAGRQKVLDAYRVRGGCTWLTHVQLSAITGLQLRTIDNYIRRLKLDDEIETRLETHFSQKMNKPITVGLKIVIGMKLDNRPIARDSYTRREPESEVGPEVRPTRYARRDANRFAILHPVEPQMKSEETKTLVNLLSLQSQRNFCLDPSEWALKPARHLWSVPMPGCPLDAHGLPVAASNPISATAAAPALQRQRKAKRCGPARALKPITTDGARLARLYRSLGTHAERVHALRRDAKRLDWCPATLLSARQRRIMKLAAQLPSC